MRTPLSQSQLVVYYGCLTRQDGSFNYQNPVLFDLPSDIDVGNVRKAVYEALCAHPYLVSRIVPDKAGIPGAESGAVPPLEEAVPVIPVKSLEEAEPGFGKVMDIHAEKLYRLEIYRSGEGKSWLYMDFHHVLADGFSIVLFLREIERCFHGKKPC